jgi:hypothetical protein
MPTIPAPATFALRATMPRAMTWVLAALPLLAMAFVPGAAIAQDAFGATAFTRAEGVAAEPTVNITRCAENRPLAFRWTLDATPSEEQRVRISTNTANTCATATEIALVTDRAAVAGDQSVEVAAQQLLEDCPAIEDENRYVCMQLYPAGGSEDGVRVYVPVRIDTIAPEPPDRVTAAPGDGALLVSWSWTDGTPSDLASVRVFRRRIEDDGEAISTTVAGRAVTSARLDGLQNDVEYEVWVQPEDEAGNVGEASESTTGSPQETVDFWDRYRELGGAETGGCASGGGLGPLALFLVGLAGLAALSRRRTRLRRAPVSLLVVLAVGAGALASPSEAEAQSSGWVDPDRRWFLELDVGPYRPEIDDEFDGAGPYEEIFGGGNETMVRLRLERAIWQGIGQVGGGLSAGFAQAVGRAQFGDGSESLEATIFNWIPLQLSLTYRFDYGALEWGIPLVPYVRAGLAYTLWWITGPSGLSRDGDGNSARGGKAGWFYGGGLKFLLNVIDPRLAADFRRSAGVHHTYLYLELTRMQVDGFGAAGFDLSDSTWFAGLAIEF